MKLTISTSLLRQTLENLQPIVNVRTTLPILSSVLLKANGKTVELTTNNLDVALTCELAASVEKPGACAVPLWPLLKILRGLPDGPVTIDGSSVRMTMDDQRGLALSLECRDADEFPPNGKFESIGSLRLPGPKLAEACADLLPFVSQDETRYIINGVCLDSSGETVHAVATDGRRLREIDLGVSMKCPAVLRSDFVANLQRMSATEKGEIALEIGDGSVRAEGKDWMLSGRLVDGNYPNWREVTPSRSENQLTFATSDLQSALALFSSVHSPKSAGVKITPNGTGALLSNHSEEQSLEIKLPVEIDGRAHPTTLNIDFLRQMADTHAGEKFTINQEDELSPVRVDCGNSVSVMMPMRVS